MWAGDSEAQAKLPALATKVIAQFGALPTAELDEMITLLVDTLERRKAFKDGRADGWAAARLKT